MVVSTVPVKSLVAAARTVNRPNAGPGVETETSTSANARRSRGIVKAPSGAIPRVIGKGVVKVATSVVLVSIATFSEMRAGTRLAGAAPAREKHVGPTTAMTTA